VRSTAPWSNSNDTSLIRRKRWGSTTRSEFHFYGLNPLTDQYTDLSCSMSWYFVRVLLHNDRLGTSYALLHKRMADIGFVPQVTSDTGVTVDLPGGMYFGYSFLDAPSVRTLVNETALEVDSNVFVLAMQVPSWASAGSAHTHPNLPLQALSFLSLEPPKYQ